MAYLETLMSMFGQDAPQVAPDGRPMNQPIVQYLEQAGVWPQQRTPEQDTSRRVSRGLQAFSEALLNPKVDFLPALAGGLSSGAGAYLNTGDENEADRRKIAMQQLEASLGISGKVEADEAADARTQSLFEKNALLADKNALQAELNQFRNAYWSGQLKNNADKNVITDEYNDARVVQGDKKIEQGDRKIDIDERQGDRKLDQGDRGLDQKDAAQAWDQIVDRDKIEISREGNRIARDRLTATTQQARDDAAAVMKRFETDQTGKADRNDAKLRVDVEKLKLDKAKSLGLDDPMFKLTDPAGYDAALRELETYNAGIMSQIGFGGPQDTRAPMPKAQPQPKAETAPASVAPTEIGGSKVVKSVKKGADEYFVTEDGKVHKRKAAAPANQ